MFGYILRGFPFNAQQALLLDRYLNGVNLAIHIKSASESAEYSSSIQPLLNYYDERVSRTKRRAHCWNSATVGRAPLQRWRKLSIGSEPPSNAQCDLSTINTFLHYLPSKAGWLSRERVLSNIC